MREVDEVETTVACLASFLSSHPEYLLLIKMHPNEDQRGKVYRPLTKDSSRAMLFTARTDTNELIEVADCVLQKHSTTGFEAIIQGTPIVLLGLRDPDRYAFMLDEGFEQEIRSCSDLEGVLDETLSDEYRKRFAVLREGFVRRHFSNPGSASRAVKDLIESA